MLERLGPDQGPVEPGFPAAGSADVIEVFPGRLDQAVGGTGDLLIGGRLEQQPQRVACLLDVAGPLPGRSTGFKHCSIGCVEYDSGRRNEAETTRRAALSLGTETDNAVITAWAHEMRAWMALTTGDYRGVVIAAQNGIDAAPHHSVAVQLAAQEAKAWARIGDRRQTEVALDRGRRLLDSLPYPDNLDHHFVVDPTKFDFYAMDCYRRLGNDPIAETLADEVIEAGTDFDGTERSPMRIAEARITLGVVAARQGELEHAVQLGERALAGERKSVPSLVMVSRDLTKVLRDRYPDEPLTKSYLDELSTVSRLPELGRPTRAGNTSQPGNQ